MNALATLTAAQLDHPTCNLHWIATQLGWDFDKRSTAALEDFTKGLIEFHGFPRPLPHRKHGGGISESVSYERSRWLRVAVLQWLSTFLPPAASDTIDAAARAAAADDMDEAAKRLFLIGGTDAQEAA